MVGGVVDDHGDSGRIATAAALAATSFLLVFFFFFFVVFCCLFLSFFYSTALLRSSHIMLILSIATLGFVAVCCCSHVGTCGCGCRFAYDCSCSAVSFYVWLYGFVQVCHRSPSSNSFVHKLIHNSNNSDNTRTTQQQHQFSLHVNPIVVDDDASALLDCP